MGGWFDTLCEGFGLNRERRSFLVRALWVIFVSGHIAWACNLLAVLGLASPFATASEVAGKYQEIAAKQDAAAAKADRIERLLQKQLIKSKATEIREVVLQICVAQTRGEKVRLLEKKDDLQAEYRELAAGDKYPEPPCEQLR